jgi:hypothetical protein
MVMLGPYFSIHFISAGVGITLGYFGYLLHSLLH